MVGHAVYDSARTAVFAGPCEEKEGVTLCQRKKHHKKNRRRVL